DEGGATGTVRRAGAVLPGGWAGAGRERRVLGRLRRLRDRDPHARARVDPPRRRRRPPALERGDPRRRARRGEGPVLRDAVDAVRRRAARRRPRRRTGNRDVLLGAPVPGLPELPARSVLVGGLPARRRPRPAPARGDGLALICGGPRPAL